MSLEKHYLALDFGAESARAILGTFADEHLEISEEYRFLTGANLVPTMYPEKVKPNLESDLSLQWDFIRLWEEAKNAIKKVAKEKNIPLSGIGIDTWGVDFGLLDRDGSLIGNPFNYRDSRSIGMMEEAFKRVPKEKIFEYTGIQFTRINSLYHLLSLVINKSPALEIAATFLTIPDLFNYFFTGKAVSEFTIATTTQCYDPHKQDWSTELLDGLGIPRRIFPKIVMPGTIVGPMRTSVAEELGVNVPVIAVACHDTGSAAAAVPAEGHNFVWISSGTWSVVGTNSPEPVINKSSFTNNFSNEGGLEGTFRFLKNVMGLWIVQECRRQWHEDGNEYSYTELTKMAKDAPALVSFIDPDYKKFLRPGKMVNRVQEYCQQTGQPVPREVGEITRAVLEGLALKYRWVIERLEEMIGHKLDTIHIIGGGTKNTLLSQFTADACGKTVITGPVEATAVGNLIVQAIAKGDISSWKEGRSIICNSFEILTFNPGDQKPWNKAYQSLRELMGK
ncbi:MAG TPA: rhamnulokinase [Anaerolineae bacterium]|nr:rhamnulokinase [Anaerolineae bacterium]